VHGFVIFNSVYEEEDGRGKKQQSVCVRQAAGKLRNFSQQDFFAKIFFAIKGVDNPHSEVSQVKCVCVYTVKKLL